MNDVLRQGRDHKEALVESEERFRALVTASSDAVYRMSPDWGEMRHLVGRDFIADLENPSRTWLETYIHPDDRAHVLAVIEEAVRTRSVFELEHRVLRVDGTVGWTFSRAVPLVNAAGEIVEWFGMASDITARKRAEEALRDANMRLADADRRKDEFLAMLAHELRNPLSVMGGASEILQRAGGLEPEVQRACDAIQRQARHMTRLVDDLLDVSRINRGTITLQRERVRLP